MSRRFPPALKRYVCQQLDSHSSLKTGNAIFVWDVSIDITEFYSSDVTGNNLHFRQKLSEKYILKNVVLLNL